MDGETNLTGKHCSVWTRSLLSHSWSLKDTWPWKATGFPAADGTYLVLPCLLTYLTALGQSEVQSPLSYQDSPQGRISPLLQSVSQWSLLCWIRCVCILVIVYCGARQQGWVGCYTVNSGTQLPRRLNHPSGRTYYVIFNGRIRAGWPGEDFLCFASFYSIFMGHFIQDWEMRQGPSHEQDLQTPQGLWLSNLASNVSTSGVQDCLNFRCFFFRLEIFQNSSSKYPTRKWLLGVKT